MAKFDDKGVRLDPEPDQYKAQEEHDKANGTKDGVPIDDKPVAAKQPQPKPSGAGR